jgi:hypothetical protein
MTETASTKSDQLFISAITQKVHTSRTCSMTSRNHAYNLDTSSSAQELAERGYTGCKRCGAAAILANAKPKAERETNSYHIAWQWLASTTSDRAARQLLATAVAKGESADRCNRITYSASDGIFRICQQS